MTVENQQQIKAQLNDCLLKDQVFVRRRLRKISQIKEVEKRNKAFAELQSKVDRSKVRVQARADALPDIRFPPELPVSQKSEEIAKAIQQNQVVVIAGETGSGKTTQIPKICMQLGRGVKGQIGHTQPRRLAARSVSMRIAEEVGSELGGVVGYQVRFNDKVSDNTLVKLMTDGILLAEIQRDRFLNAYDTIIIDEAHERSLNIDFLLGYLKRLLPKRPDLKVIITSATIDVERFSKHFDNAPVIEVSGRAYSVETRYRPLYESEDGDDDRTLNEAVLQSVLEIVDEEKTSKKPFGDILVFLPGEREIRDLAKYLRDYEIKDTEVLPLYARLSAADQLRVFKSHKGRRIVLSTNVAETSITVPGIRYVIDPGTARISRYSYRSKIQRLPVEAISQASANQRKGRCGRVAEGICYRLYSEEDFNNRPEFTDAEILRTNLASVILKMIDLGFGQIDEFPFVDSPDKRLINDGFKLLFELGAVDSKRQMTDQGKVLAKIPVDPRIGRMLIEANNQGSLTEVLIITSALSIQDPRERPAEKKQAADQAHAAYKDPDSDFVSFVNLWNQYEEERQALSSNQLKKHCLKNYLSFMRMREWREVHRQLHLICKELKFTENAAASGYEAIHRSLLSGLLNNIGAKEDKKEYKGARNRHFNIFPGSACYKKPPKWIVSAELVETSQVFARINAKIEPQWVEPLAAHIVKHSYFEPHWEQKRGQVVAFERISLYGLDIVPKRKIHYGTIDSKVSRELFIRHALVQGELRSKAPFLRENSQLIEQVDELETRIRKKDILIDDDTLFDFYEERIPTNIISGRYFESWWKKLGPDQLSSLRLTKEFVMKREASEVNESSYPDTINLNNINFKLNYNFAPGQEGDGVSIVVPKGAVRQLPLNRLEWMVPGLLREKCIQLVKSLPRSIRKQFVPVPDYVDQALKNIKPSNEPVTRVLGQQLTRITGVKIPEESWNSEAVDEHLKFNIQVVDEAGKVDQESRDVLGLMEQFKDVEFDVSVGGTEEQKQYQTEFTDWSFGELPLHKEVDQGGIKLNLMPTLEDHKRFVKLALSNDRLSADKHTIRAVARLTLLALPDQKKYILSKLPKFQQTSLMFAPFVKAVDLSDDLLMGSLIQLLSEREMPRSAEQFTSWLTECRAIWFEHTCELALLLNDIALQHHNLMKQLKGKINLALAHSMTDLKFQLNHLVYNGFISQTPKEWLKHFPRYLEAANERFEKMPREMGNERTFLATIDGCWDQYESLKAQHEQQGIFDLELEKYRWMIEELRVSWFAQKLGTAMTISEKRLNKQWDLVRK
ncbi:ATP-dependent RNA helicase HrpA [Alkalimarinus sediminis]|uniref:ATP-dependent RNA helicase HrpA n=1 Tax=Alkalimarinus sediminis TaxID=1632866 RepID=A0A9E8HT29_9ALTE|nr:ATP-dependent RNA helicase HrpA [Alkalimarinus sediminis]UZW76016.1 ATP-dependent RNA helicase HrpA [Alkalimarinus sediminis]